MLKNITKIQATEVPYKGGVDAVKDLLGGQIHFIFSDTLPAMAHVRAGKLRALCITGAEKLRAPPRPAALPAGRPGPCRGELVGRARPRRHAAGHRRQAARRHGQAPRRPGREEELRQPRRGRRGEHAGANSAPSSEGETDKYAKLIKEANIKVNQ